MDESKGKDILELIKTQGNIIFEVLTMKGIQFVIDDNGAHKAVLIDLEQWGDLWEDFYDVLVSKMRENEEEISWDILKEEVEQARKEND